MLHLSDPSPFYSHRSPLTLITSPLPWLEQQGLEVSGAILLLVHLHACHPWKKTKNWPQVCTGFSMITEHSLCQVVFMSIMLLCLKTNVMLTKRSGHAHIGTWVMLFNVMLTKRSGHMHIGTWVLLSHALSESNSGRAVSITPAVQICGTSP